MFDRYLRAPHIAIAGGLGDRSPCRLGIPVGPAETRDARTLRCIALSVLRY
jgi:hypothetical protein